MNYCLPVYGNVFHLEKYKLSDVRYTNYTMKDNNFLQVLQNKVNRILTSSSLRTPTIELLQKTNSLSIQQMIAYQTLITLFKISLSSKPHYLATKIKFKNNICHTRSSDRILEVPKYRLSQSKEGFLYRGVLLFNQLDIRIRKIETLEEFKAEVQRWVKTNIPAKPRKNQ